MPLVALTEQLKQGLRSVGQLGPGVAKEIYLKRPGEAQPGDLFD